MNGFAPRSWRSRRKSVQDRFRQHCGPHALGPTAKRTRTSGSPQARTARPGVLRRVLPIKPALSQKRVLIQTTSFCTNTVWRAVLGGVCAKSNGQAPKTQKRDHSDFLQARPAQKLIFALLPAPQNIWNQIVSIFALLPA